MLKASSLALSFSLLVAAACAQTGGVGIGTTTPAQRLDIHKGRLRFSGDSSAGLVQGIEFTNAAGTALNGFVGKYNDSMMGLFGYTGAGWRFLFNNTNGNVGLQGNSNPRAPLSFANFDGNKISLFGNASGAHYGIGISPAAIQLYTSAATEDILFGYGSSTAFTERMRIRGNGNVGIGTPAPAQKLDIFKGRIRFSGDPLPGAVSQGIEFTNTAGTALNGFVGGFNDSMMGLYGFAGAGWQFLFNNINGNVGLQGNTNPRAPLSLSTALGNKVALWGGADGGHFGIGIQAAKLQLYADGPTSDIVFGHGSSAAFTENVRMMGNGNVGIGTASPDARLDVSGGSVVFNAGYTSAPGPPPPTYGSIFVWYKDKGALRAGNFISTPWSADSIGLNSIAGGTQCKASGAQSFATGFDCQAEGLYSAAVGYLSKASNAGAMALGYGAIATGHSAVALGYGTTASGVRSFAVGSFNQATGAHCVAMGGQSTASGQTSVAIGSNVDATGAYSLAMGSGTEASGNNSTALGNSVTTAGFDGAFVIGDNLGSMMYSSAANQLRTRFAGGYQLFSNSVLTAGVSLAPGGGSWTSVSDRRRKENFRAIDPEEILKKVVAMPVTRWNYKSQPATQQHIGPMAQDFYAAFGLDGVGADTTINTADIDGVAMAAIQALEKRTAMLQKANAELVQQVAVLRAEKEEVVSTLMRRLDALEQRTATSVVATTARK